MMSLFASFEIVIIAGIVVIRSEKGFSCPYLTDVSVI